MKIEICYDAAHDITVATLVGLVKDIYEDMPDMELDDVIAMSRTAESIMGTLRYLCTDTELNEMLKQS